MRFTILLTLLAIGALFQVEARSHIQSVDLDNQFNWEAGGTQIATGNFTTHTLYSSNVTIPPQQPGQCLFAIKPSAKFMHFDLGFVSGKFWFFTDRVLISLAGTCYLVANHTYDLDIIHYKWARKVAHVLDYSKEGMLANIYSGLISKAGSCSNRNAITILQSSSENGRNSGRLLSMSFAGSISFGSFIPIFSFVGTLDFNDWDDNADWDPLTRFPIPSECTGTLVDWCSAFFPNQDGQCLYPPKDTVSL